MDEEKGTKAETSGGETFNPSEAKVTNLHYEQYQGPSEADKVNGDNDGGDQGDQGDQDQAEYEGDLEADAEAEYQNGGGEGEGGL